MQSPVPTSKCVPGFGSKGDGLEVQGLQGHTPCRPLKECTEMVVACWQLKKAVNEFEQCLHKEKQRVSATELWHSLPLIFKTTHRRHIH